MASPIYLDYAATTPVDNSVINEMMKYLPIDGIFANPSSQHSLGQAANKAVDESRAIAAEFLCCNPGEIIFTSGATESNNIAIKGIAKAYQEHGNHIITSQTEHKSVLDTYRVLESQGFEVTYLTPDKMGCISKEELESAIRPETILVSIMHVNNETGVIQEINSLGSIVKNKYKIYFHVDAAQSFGKLPIDLDNSPVDLLSCSSHKIYGPKGVGILYIRNRAKTRLIPLMNGGGQEFGIRPGTLPTHQITGLGKAIEIARNRMTTDSDSVALLHHLLKQGLAEIDGAVINNPEHAIPNILNISINGIDSITLVTSLQNEVAISSGSACTSGSIEPSHVLRAMGVDEGRLHSSVRISIGRYTTTQDIKTALNIISKEVCRIRSLMN